MDTDIIGPILAVINEFAPWVRFFAFRAMMRHADTPLVPQLLLVIDDSWKDGIPLQMLREFLYEQKATEIELEFGPLIEQMTAGQANILQDIFSMLDPAVIAGLRQELDAWKSRHVDSDFLRSIGRVWDEVGTGVEKVILEHPAMMRLVAELAAMLQSEQPRSVILVGESGVGKSALLQKLAEHLQSQKWLVFEASGTDLIAGQVFIGELEDRLKTLVQTIAGKRNVLWIVPNFHNLLWSGQSRFQRTGILDYLLPRIKRGEIILIGETLPLSFNQLLRLKPELKAVFQVFRVLPLLEEETLALASRWREHHSPSIIDDATLREAQNLVQQYLS